MAKETVINLDSEPQKDNLSTEVLTSGSGCLQWVKGQLNIIIIFLAVVLGLIIGLGLREFHLSDEVIVWLGLPGDLYMRSLKNLIVPLLVCLIINTTSTLDPKTNGRIALVACLVFFVTHLAASVLSLCLFFAFRPEPQEALTPTTIRAPLKTSDVFADLFRKMVAINDGRRFGHGPSVVCIIWNNIMFFPIKATVIVKPFLYALYTFIVVDFLLVCGLHYKNMFPDNMVRATFSQTLTTYKSKIIQEQAANISNENLTTVEIMERTLGRTDGVNVLGLLTICTAIGVAIHKVLPVQASFRCFFREAQTAIAVIINWVFWLTPFAVTSLIVGSLAKIKDIWHTFEVIGLLIATVSVGLAAHLFVVLPILFFVITKQNPFKVIARCSRVMAVSFASTSSSVAFPDMIAVSKKCGARDQVTHFVLSMAMSLHADGSNIYIASSALFIGQLTGSLDSMATVLVVVTLCTLMSIIIPPIPSASIMTLILIFHSLNIPAQEIAMLFAVEWLLDRLRSGVNSVSHVMCILVTNWFCKDFFPPDDVTAGDVDADDEPNEETAMVVSVT